MTRSVGEPGPHEAKCPTCDGHGQLPNYTGQYPTGYPLCDTCDATGVVPVMVPTISLWQPWASLIFTGDKQHETRAYPPPAKHIGKRIAIHAAKRVAVPFTLGLELLCEREFGSGGWRILPRGAIIGTVLLVGFGRTEDVDPGTVANRIAGDWTPGRYAWELANPLSISPVPWRGKQGWFLVPEADIAGPPPCGPVPVDTGALKRSLVYDPRPSL